MPARKTCPHCHARVVAGRAAVHLSGACQKEWYRAIRAQHGRHLGRPKDTDLPPEVIERLMQRRAAEQKRERLAAQSAVALDTTKA